MGNMNGCSFVLDLDMSSRYSLNKIYAGAHWSARKADASMVHQMVGWTLRRAGIPDKCFEKPVRIELLYNCKLDIDNCGWMTKMIIDGLKGHLIADDTKKYVRYVGQGFWNGAGILVEVREMEEAS